MISPCSCPICGKPLSPSAAADSLVFPFCSPRCKQIDLYRWTEGKYAITEPLTPEDFPAPVDEEPGDEG
ncbi:MAG: DNA gyrase inhibitor YacG [Minicystis sp.]